MVKSKVIFEDEEQVEIKYPCFELKDIVEYYLGWLILCFTVRNNSFNIGRLIINLAPDLRISQPSTTSVILQRSFTKAQQQAYFLTIQPVFYFLGMSAAQTLYSFGKLGEPFADIRKGSLLMVTTSILSILNGL